MGRLTQAILEGDPTYQVYRKEYQHYFLSFCTLVCHLGNKKMNLPNIFITLIKNGFWRRIQPYINRNI